jgi:hypothetical protein
VTFPLTQFQFTPTVQRRFIRCIATAAEVSVFDVAVVSFGQSVISGANISRRLLQERILEVHSRISKINPLSPSDYDFVRDKKLLDSLFQQQGLPQSLAVGPILLCKAGQYSITSADTACSLCEVGKFSSLSGQVTTCQMCASGDFNLVAGSTSCLVPSNTAGNSTDQTTSTPGQIAGYTLAGIALLSLIVLGILLCVRISHKQQKGPRISRKDSEPLGPKAPEVGPELDLGQRSDKSGRFQLFQMFQFNSTTKKAGSVEGSKEVKGELSNPEKVGMNTQAQLVIPFGLPQSNESSGTK